MTTGEGDFYALRGTPTSASAQKPADTQRWHHGRPSSTQTTKGKAAWMAHTRAITRAILGLMWLKFLSVNKLGEPKVECGVRQGGGHDLKEQSRAKTAQTSRQWKSLQPLFWRT
ncbi:MAG: hypothetical protein AN488_20760 [Anabaena sp. WA113]|nr:MAG: hypothetical protein AN488_20760 [Anabaena sp. WA113]